jgi:hypothetical protein
MIAIREYERTGRSDRAQDLIEMAGELRELDRLANRKGGSLLRYFNARYYLRSEVREAAQRVIGAGCP